MPSNAHAGLEGKWKSLLLMAGFTEKELSGKNVPCPECGGKDRFRFTDKGEGMFICSHCGGGDGFRLLGLKLHTDFKGAMQWVQDNAGAALYKPVQKVDYTKNRNNIAALLRRATGARGLIGEFLINQRSLSHVHANDNNLHFDPKCLYIDGKYRETGPAILADYYAVDDEGRLSDELITILRHWITLGHKRVMPPAAEMRAVACPLGPAVGDFLGVAEGLYTAMAYREIILNATGHDVPVWSAYSAESLKHFVPPACVKRLHICMDVDISFTGQAAAYDLAKRLHGLRPDLNIRVVRPCTNDGCDFDFNDWIKEKRRDQKQESQGPVQMARAC